jgi:HSP20 family protein
MFLVPLARRPQDLARSIDRLFDASFERLLAATPQPDADGTRSPALDVAENEAGYTARLDMPGVGKDQIQVAVDGRRVTVQARAERDAAGKEGERVLHRERVAAGYARSFTLPAELDQAAVVARLENGVLTLVLPRRAAPAAAKITIN